VCNVQDVAGSAHVQLCGAFAVELSGRRVDQAFPGRQGRLLFGYLCLFRLQPVPRDTLVDVLWGDSPPARAGGALSVLVSKVRAVGGTAQFVARRRFLPEAETPWAESWRRRLADVHARALECYASACLGLAGPELPGAERAARELVEIAPLGETGHLLLMQTLAASGNVAEALAAYERLRVLLREELGVSPSQAVQDTYTQLLG
jgi:SARP family transcriptional regulator, regulator of embCAB operon